jgi:agmatinase
VTEIVKRGLDSVLDEALTIATTDCDAVFLSVDVDVVDPGDRRPARVPPSRGAL